MESIFQNIFLIFIIGFFGLGFILILIDWYHNTLDWFNDLFKSINSSNKTKQGLTAFMIAILFGDDELTEVFIKHGANIKESIIYKPKKVEIKSPHLPEFHEEVTVSPFMMAFHNYNSKIFNY